MTQFNSDIKKIQASSEDVFIKLTNLENLRQLEGTMLHEKVKISKVTQDSCTFEVDMIGEIEIKLTNKEPNHLIVFQSQKSPLAFDLSIKLTEMEQSTGLQIQLNADLPMMLKMMVSEPINKFVNILADTLTRLSY
jgi:carbon monoxide dehydrogenase subunit G